VLAIPFAKPAVRRGARFAIQRLPLSEANKERVYNLVAADAVSLTPVSCHVRTPGGGLLSLELDLTDDLSRKLYYFGYRHYERSIVLLWSRLLANVTTVFDVGANIGLYTMAAAMRLAGRGAVYSFEPNSEVFSCCSIM
jgi:hypothetical protein